MFNSLTKKMLAVIILLIIICSTLLTGVSYYEIQRSVTSQMKSDGTTLILNIKGEISKNKISDYKGLQDIFKEIKLDSDENIVYISLSDENAKVIVSDNSELANVENGSSVDAISSATEKGMYRKLLPNKKLWDKF